MKSEFRKLLVHNSVLFLFFFTIAAQIVVSWQRPRNVYCNSEELNDPVVYQELVAAMEGPVTEERLLWAQQEKEHLKQVNQTMEDAYQAARDGSGTYTEYRQLVSEMPDIMERIRVQDSLYQQMQKASKVPGTSMIDTTGWLQLFGDGISPVGIVYFLFLVVFLTPFYVVDMESHMDLLLRTSKRGRAGLWFRKLFCGGIVMAGMCLLLNGIDYASVALQYPNGLREALVQSIPCYVDIPWNITLYQMFGLRILLQISGGLYLQALLAFACAVWKRTMPVLVLFLLSGCMHVLLCADLLFYQVPLPLAWMGFTGLCPGIPDLYEWEKSVRISNVELLQNGIISTLLLIGTSVLGCLYYLHGKWKKSVLAMLCVTAVVAAGLYFFVPKEQTEWADVPVNSSDGFDCAENSYGKVQIEDGKGWILWSDTGEKTELLLDPFLGDETMLLYVSADADAFYATGSTEMHQFACRVDCATMKKRVVYESDLFGEKEHLAFLEQQDSYYRNTTGMPEVIGQFLAYRDHYILTIGNQILVLDRLGRTERILDTDYIGGAISIYNQTLYYSDRQDRIRSVSIETGEQAVVADDLTEKIYVTEQGLYGLNVGGEVWKYGETEKTQVPLAGKAMTFRIRGRELFYSRQDSRGIYRYQMDTGEEEQLYEGNVYSFTVLSDEIVVVSESGTHSIPIEE